VLGADFQNTSRGGFGFSEPTCAPVNVKYQIVVQLGVQGIERNRRFKKLASLLPVPLTPANSPAILSACSSDPSLRA
jgi:hypothetical protein